MCRTPEEAAWTVLSMTAEQRAMRTLTKAITQFLAPKDVFVDIHRDAARRSVFVTLRCTKEFSEELWRQLAQEAEREPTLVG